MTESILVTFFCFMPFGIMGIINSWKVGTAYSAGEYEEAQEHSENAEKWVMRGVMIGIIWIVAAIMMAIIGKLY